MSHWNGLEFDYRLSNFGKFGTIGKLCEVQGK